MANICFYKVLVKGRKKVCEKLLDIMPSDNNWIRKKEGTDEDYGIVFTGECGWGVDAHTEPGKVTHPYSEAEIDAIDPNIDWKIPLQEKSLALSCEIFCNSRDIDEGGPSEYVHYKNGEIINDECPEELHIKRGRDYDVGLDLIETEYGLKTKEEYDRILEMIKTPTARVKFENGVYWYINSEKYEINDIVYVDGAKLGCLGKIVEVSNMFEHYATEKIKEKVGTVGPFNSEEIEGIWKSYKPKDRKEFLQSIEIDEAVSKQKFLNIMEARWNKFGLNNNWEEFIKNYK